MNPKLVDDIADANVMVYQSHQCVEVKFKSEGAECVSRITRENVGHRLAIMLGETVLSTPVIREPITNGHVLITGNFTDETALHLVRTLQSGSIPVPINIIDDHPL